MIDIEPFEEKIPITRPLFPSLKDVNKKLKEIWETKWLTNFGTQHKFLKKRLKKYLEVKNISLFNNGTLALDLALKALKIKGEVITTPFTFPATTNVLILNEIKPVFCDISPKNLNLNVNQIEDLITSNTSAILPVHVYGNPCETEKIQSIADQYGFKVIYDAAHAFGVKYKGRPIGSFGDISMFSFHATKIFHTIEGGALAFNNDKFNEKLYLLKNFGIKNEEEIILAGTNAKLNELQAAIGLINLKLIDQEIEKRKVLTRIYQLFLKKLKGIRVIQPDKEVNYNYQYFPIIINEEEYGISRNELYEHLKKFNIFSRKYFYPICSQYDYIKKQNIRSKIPIAEKLSEQILCLPLYGTLKKDQVKKICKIIEFSSKN